MCSFEWTLRLFFSVDLVGSTAFKVAESKKDVPEWAHTFREFFRDFPLAIERHAAELGEKYFKCPESPRPWKFSGDEILFWVALTDHRQTATHIASFKSALLQFPNKWSESDVPLKLKATAWIAGFPVTNSEVSIRTDSSTTLDFIGPSIDAGFRLTKFSQPRKFILSADLALMLLDAIHRSELPWSDFHLFYDGVEPLKGVLDGEPYPVIWLDMEDGRQSTEEKLQGTARESKPHLLREYLAEFVDKKMARPFIEGDNDEKYNKIPPTIIEKRDRMKALESQTSETGTAEDSKGTEPEIPPPKLPERGDDFLPGVPG